MKKVLIPLFLVFSLFAKSQTPFLSVYFDSDSYSFYEKPIHVKILLDSLNAYDDCSIKLVGNTDNKGSDEYNLKLGEKRCLEVQKFLFLHATDIRKYQIVSRGESAPIHDNKSEEGRAKNRRVDIYINGNTKPAQKTLEPVQKLFDQLKTPSQIYCIKNDMDTALQLEHGSILYIKANSFRMPVNHDCECITIEAKERFKKSDIYLDQLTTMSNGDILISQSMMYLAAYCQEIPLTLNKPIVTFTPTSEVNPDMRVYRGVLDENSNVNWVDADLPIPSTMSTVDIIQNCSEFEEIFAYCPFFFCKIKRFFNPNYEQRAFTSSTRNDSCPSIKNKRQEIEEKFGNLDLGKMNQIPKEDIEYYVFSRNLGWSNLDWMAKIDQKVLFKVNVPGSKNIDIKVVFKRMRSVVPLKKYSKSYKASLPEGYAVTIVALKYEDSTPYLALKEVNVSDVPIDSLDFKAMTIPELKEALKVLD